MELLGIPSIETLRVSHGRWVEEALRRAELSREPKWTESVAVGGRNFVETVKARLKIRGKGRKISGTEVEASLHEPQDAYDDVLVTKTCI